MEAGKNNTRLKKWGVWVGVILVFILFVTVLINRKLSGIVEQKVNAYLQQNGPKLYDISLKKLDLNLIAGSVKIDSIQINPRLNLLNDSVPGLYKGTIGLLKVTNFRYTKFLANHAVKLKNITLSGADLSFTPNPDYVKIKKKPNAANKSSMLGPNLQSIEVETIAFKDGNFVVYDPKSTHDTAWSIHKFSLLLDAFKVDSVSAHQEPPFTIQGFMLKGEDILSSKSDKYTLKIADFELVSSRHELVLNGFSLTPKLSRKAFSKNLKFEDDMFDIDVASIILSDLNLMEILSEKRLDLSSIQIQEPVISIYRDKRVVDGPFKHKPLVTSAIKKIPLPVHISQITMMDGKLTYEEKQENDNPPGMIYFDLQNVSITNVCNITSEIHQNPVMQADFQTKIMGQGALTAHFDFNLNYATDSFTMKGKLGKIAASAFNPMAENMLNVKITAGTVNKAEFNFGGTDNSSAGLLELHYSDLKVEVLKDDASHNGFMTLAANSLVEKNNQPEDKKYRLGYMNFDRDKNKGFPNYLWKTILTGIKPIVVPISTTKEQKDKQKLSDAAN